VTLWESRTSPDFFYKKGRFNERPFFICLYNYYCSKNKIKKREGVNNG